MSQDKYPPHEKTELESVSQMAGTRTLRVVPVIKVGRWRWTKNMGSWPLLFVATHAAIKGNILTHYAGKRFEYMHFRQYTRGHIESRVPSLKDQ